MRVQMWKTLWISLFVPLNFAWGWGAVGHTIIAESATALVDTKAWNNCHITAAQIVAHTNDPDNSWKSQRAKHPNEAQAHYFHVDHQPSDWRKLKDAKEIDDGFLVYRIAIWAEDAGKLRKAGKWDELAEKLYGLSHYMGDLTQPLHLHHDHDGVEAGLTGLHSQFETRMIGRYQDLAYAGVKKRLTQEKIPALWKSLELRELVFNIAQQSMGKTEKLFADSKLALQKPSSRKGKKPRPDAKPRFVKKELWKDTGEFAMDQLALGSRLVAHAINSICQ